VPSSHGQHSEFSGTVIICGLHAETPPTLLSAAPPRPRSMPPDITLGECGLERWVHP
jgi:hypothetical protein